MRRWIGLGAIVLGLLGALWGFVATALADRPPNNAANATADTVREAIALEAAAMTTERNRLLDDLLANEPEAAPARWQRGFIRTKTGWINVAELGDSSAPQATGISAASNVPVEYEALRNRVADDLNGNLVAARWCQRKGLTESARGHWFRALDLDPENEDARRALGHVRDGDGWLTREDRLEREAWIKAVRNANTKWESKVVQWVEAYHSRDYDDRQKAAASLRSIRDPAASPLLVSALNGRTPEAGLLLVEILDAMPDLMATRALAETGVTSEHESVRVACARALKQRDEHAFAPQLLAAMSSPVTSQMQLAFDNSGRLFYRHTFVREGQEIKHVQNYNTVFITGGDLARASRISLAGAERAARQTEQEMDRQNDAIKMINDRIGKLLTNIYGVSHKQPEDWWNWWNECQQVQLSGAKQISIRNSNQLIPVVVASQRRRSDCFVEGTPVWTPSGKKPIESLRPGDLVLSQNPVNGELAFKAVVRPTERPAAELTRIEIGQDTLVCTPGHFFWATGSGWTKAKDLEPGMTIRTANGSQVVSAVEDGPNAVTHNLIVADFRSYFVGEEMTYCHDNTELRPTLAIAPGVYPAAVAAPAVERPRRLSGAR